MPGFLNTGATRNADLALIAELVMGLALLAGWWLARRRRFGAHAACQTTVMVLNPIVIGLVMIPSFSAQIAPHVARAARDPYYAYPLVHAALGTTAQLLGWYVVLVARGIRVVPQALQFRNFRLWMRTTLALWWIVILFGIATYGNWYMHSDASATLASPTSATVVVRNFAFDPQELTIAAGGTITWTNTGGRHTVESADGTFNSGTLVAGQSFQRRFDTPGTYAYFCANHGTKAGAGMTGKITVNSR